jgi:hypothetical protein
VEWLTKGALPIGLLMFAGMFLAVLLRRIRFKRTAASFPALATKLGLRFKQPSSSRAIGSLQGRYQGYQVFVDPDEQRRINVRFSSEPRIDLRNYEHRNRPPLGMHTFFSGDKRFDGFFKTRYVDDEVGERLTQVEDLTALLRPFQGAYYRQLKQLNVTTNGVTCILDFGNPPHIPPAAVEHLLPAMVSLARVIEPRMGSRAEPHEDNGKSAR